MKRSDLVMTEDEVLAFKKAIENYYRDSLGLAKRAYVYGIITGFSLAVILLNLYILFFK